jgi:outer membrane receptor protein involved in Fe transport
LTWGNIVDIETITAGAMGARLQRGLGARRAALATVSAAVLGIALAGAASEARAQTEPEAVQEVVVTGSRIVRRDYVSNSPIVTLNAKTFEDTPNIAIESTLNKLPQFTPDQDLNGRQSRDFSPTGGHSVGVSTLSLRGLGPNRNLILADGQRLTPINGQMVVDLNTIPSSMIERVEVITGGASAVYGADAVGGVVNFILKKNFQGLTMDSQWGKTEAGDGREFKFSATMGTNFADDRGNVTISAERYDRAASYQRNRDFYTKGFSDPTVANNEGVFIGAAFHPEVGNFPSQAVVDSLFPNRPAGTRVPNGGADFYFNTDGTVFGGANGLATQGAVASVNYKGVVNGTSVAYQTVLDAFNSFTPQRALKSNALNYYVTSPLSRWSFYEAGHYKINDWLTVFLNGSYNRTKSNVAGSPATFVNGWSVLVPVDAAHPVPAQLAAMLASRPNPTAPWNLFLSTSPDSGWMPGRGQDVSTQTFQINFGFNGKVPNTDWTWTLQGSHGESSAYFRSNGFASLVRYRAMILAPNYGKGASITGNQGLPGAGFNAGTGVCTSGFYDVIFSGGTPSADCVKAIVSPMQFYNEMAQNVAEFDAQGGLFKLPAGQVRGSVGASYRDNSIVFTPDALSSTTNFADQVVGGNAIAPIDAKIKTKEVYGELLAPLLADLPLVRKLDLELGARYSTYSNADSGLTYKVLGDWQVTDWLRFRGGYNRAVRAPNLAESFQGRQNGFGVAGATAYGDPCSLRAIAPFGANAATNTGGAAAAAQTLAICQALMGPIGAQTYYGLVQNPGAPASVGSYFEQGNPNLDTEKADTFTAGLVLRSPFVDSPVFGRMTLSVDWYSIKIKGAIQLQNADIVNKNCYTQSGTAAAVAASAACQLIVRNQASGQDLNKTVVYDNLATIDTSGVDFAFDWTAALKDMSLGLPGVVNLHLVGSYVDHYRTQQAAGQVVREWDGTLGPTLTGTSLGVYKYKLNTTVNYIVGPLTVGLNWRFLPRVRPATWGQVGNNTLSTPAWHMFDLNGSFAFMNRYTLRAGVSNLFNTDPKITGANLGIPNSRLATTGQGTTNESLYDALGRRFYVGLKANF